ASDEQGSTMVRTTHYMEEADQLCDRLGIIDQGKLLAFDTPSHLKAHAPGETMMGVMLDGDAAPLLSNTHSNHGVSSAKASGPLLRVYSARAGEIIPAVIAA